MTLVQAGQKKKQKISNTGIPKELYEKLKSYSWEELEDFLQKLSRREDIIRTKQEKGCEAFVRIPNILLEKHIENEKDRIVFLLSVHFFNYGQANKLLKYTALELEEFIWATYEIEPTKFAKEIDGNYDIINIKYVRPFFRITPAQKTKTEKVIAKNVEVKDVITEQQPEVNIIKNKVEQKNKNTSKSIECSVSLDLLKKLQVLIKTLTMGEAITYDEYVELAKIIGKCEENYEEDDIFVDFYK